MTRKLVTLLLAALLLAPVHALAQDATDEPTPAPEVTPEPPPVTVDPFPTIPPVETSADSLLTWLLSETNGARSLAIVVGIVTLLKRWKALNHVPANWLLSFTAVGYVVCVWIARNYGVANEFAQGSNFVAGLIDLVLNIGTGAGVVAIGSGLSYEAAKIIKLPGVKYQRPPQAAKAV